METRQPPKPPPLRIMSLPSPLSTHGRCLCLLSLDAGGTRGVSQLKILAELMHRLNFDGEKDQVLLPCDVFDMIGGCGSGGFIAILLGVLGLNADQALDDFIELSVNVLEKHELDALARTTALGVYIDKLLKKYKIEKETRLLDTGTRSKGSKILIPVLHNRNIRHVCMLRNFDTSQEEDLNFTIAEAMLATLTSPPLFTPASISTVEYIGGDLKFSNPTLTIVSEAYKAFGEDASVACLMNIGCGHPGFLSPPSNSDLESWKEFLDKVMKDSEQKAEEIESQMGNLGLYYRFSASGGLEGERQPNTPTTRDALQYTIAYLSGVAVSRKLETCVDSLRSRDGVASLGQLKYSGGQDVIPPALPRPTRAFVMRKKPWEFIEKAMLGVRSSADADEPRMLVVTGIGGCGKTQLILKFIQVHKSRFAATLFIDGSSIPRIRADTIRHARSLGIAHSQKGFDDCLLFLSKPRHGPPRLILYDNVDDPDIDLAPLLPSGESCAILITSRNHSIGQLCPEAHLELDTMSMDEAVDLLLHRPGRPTVITAQMREAMGAIAQVLGCLPIALTQARSYMFQTKCSGTQYLRRLLESQDKLLAVPVKHHREMRYMSTYAAFHASFTLLTFRCQQLLRLLSYFHWANFPVELVPLAAKYNFSDYERTYVEHGREYYSGRAMLKEIFLDRGKWDITELDEMIVLLQNHSLITLTPGTGTQLSQMHPLAHGWVRSCVPEEDSATYESAAALLLALGARSDYTPASQYLASHVSHISAVWDKLDSNSAQAFGDILDDGGLYADALLLRERVVKEVRSQAEPDSETIRTSLGLLALTYRNLGRWKEAVVLQEEVLKLSKKVLGARHPNTISASANLAVTYWDLGRLKETMLLEKEVLKVNEEVLGERHLDTIMASSNLSGTYRALGRLKEAEGLQEKVLKLRKELLGEMHPDTISASSNLALTYRDLGRLKEAQVLQEEGLKLTKELLGEMHPDTIMASNNLSGTYRDLGRLKEAEALQEKVLELRREMLGETHPDTIAASSNLAVTYWDLGRLKEAEVLQVKVLKVRMEELGEMHPDTITASSNLAFTYRDLGRLEEAVKIQVNVVERANKVMGPRHPETIWASANLAGIYYALGRLDDARPLLEEVLRMRKEILGDNHPDTIEAAKNLANTYCSLGRLSEVRALHKEVVSWRERSLGERHPATTSSRAYLAVTLYKLGEFSEAEVLQAGVLAVRIEVFGESHHKSAKAMLDMAETCHALGRKDQAVQLTIRANTIIVDSLGQSHPMYKRCQDIISRIQSDVNVSGEGPSSIVQSASTSPIASPSPHKGSKGRLRKLWKW